MEAETTEPCPPPPAPPRHPKKKMPRPPSPARPKDVSGWSLAKTRRSGHSSPGSPASFSSRAGVVGGPPAAGRRSGKTDKKHTSKNRSKDPPGRGGSTEGDTRAKGVGPDPLPGKASCPLGDSSSEESSDCASEENKLSSDGEGARGQAGACEQDDDSLPSDQQEGGASLLEAPDATDEGLSQLDEPSLDSRLHLSTSLAFSDLTEELMDSMQEGFLREMDELRSENDYLKDEIEELRSEMLEMRDVYMEEDVYQLQELRQQLEQVNKTCRILQYRLRKAERRSLRVAQTGHVDGEFIHSLEQDVKVAKDVSVRLHNELESVEKKRVKLEEENEDLRQRLIETEVAKQVLLNEMDKLKENSLKKRGGRPSGKVERKSSLQEDSADLKCQLHFAKEESTLMCKKLTKLAKDNDSMKEDLLKYSSLYGDLDSTLSIEELADSPHSREAELKVHLKLVEEEANLLSRRIVELEVENRGLRAEMDEMKGQGDKDLVGHDVRLNFSPTNYGESGEKFLELGKHLQFVEEEAELLRRSLMELEDQNKLLMNELNKYKSEHDLDITFSEDSCSLISEPSQEELSTAKVQINELNGKVKKLQYENRVLLSNLQRYDLASCPATRPMMETDAEAGDSAQCIPTALWREGTASGENSMKDYNERTGGNGTIKSQDTCRTSPSKLFETKDFENLLHIRDQAGLVSKAIEVLISDANGFSSGMKICKDNDCADLMLTDMADNNEATNDSKLSNILFVRLGVLQQQLNCFMKRVDNLGDCLKDHIESSLSSLSGSLTPRGLKESVRKEQVSSIQIKELQLVLSEANDSIRGLQEQLTQERQMRKEEPETFNQKLLQLKEDHQKALLRREFELQSLNLQRRLEQKFWSQEKNLLVQESQQFKQNFLLLFMKLKWFLKRWRQGKILPNEDNDFLEVNSIKELYLLIEEEELNPQQINAKRKEGESWSQNMTNEYIKTLADMKVILKELCGELRDERKSMGELQQQFAKAKSAWEIEKTEFKCHAAQLDSGKQMPDKDLKFSLKREREEHQHLLTESYSAVMDLTKQLQISQKNWEQEKAELLERYRDEQKQAEQIIKELQNKVTQLQKEADPWVLRQSEMEKSDSCWKEALNEKMQDKDSDSEAEPIGSNLKRTKSFSSMSEFESMLEASPFLPGRNGPITNENLRAARFVASDLASSMEQNQKNCPFVNKDKALAEHLSKDNLDISSWDNTLANNTSRDEPVQKHMQRSYTAPDKTGIRIYYSPPVVRRLDAPSPWNQEGKSMAEPGFLFTMAKPKDLDKSDNCSENTYNRWLQNFSKQQQEILDTANVEDPVLPVPVFQSALGNFEISGNMSDDMKEITNCVRQAIRSSSLERKVKNTSSQTVGLSNVGTQTIRMVSIGLQTEIPRGSIHAKSWSPRSSSLLSARSKQISTSLDKVHSRIERPCCSPKYGSPKLQRRSSSKLDGSKDRSLWSLHQSKPNGSAWARSTTTRDSPVLSNINDGLSSLFNVVEHSGSTESLWKPGPQESPAKPDAPKYGIVQEFLRNVCGRSQSPTTTVEKKDRAGEDSCKKQETPSIVIHQSDNAPKTLHKRILKQINNDEQKPPPAVQSSKDGTPRDVDIISSTEDAAPCDCSSQSLTSCFARPSRSSGRHSPTKCKHHPSEPPFPEEKTGSAGE
ncbi:microtubule cross-linking factor 2 isoform X2 [Ambystoma mexicanum]|uniref:microtubule cross-linking factor 2 isoform X2 n=1 Tax=Ambystoma mexicanum TaxID=8296 RepID=UPI0037E723B7